MTEVASRELRNGSRALLDRVAQGETILITVDGRPVARLGPVGRRPRWLPRAEFLAKIVAHQADPGLARDLAEISDETIHDLPFR